MLPEVFDINPKEILILNPQQGKVYGYNSKNKVLTSTDIEIDNKEDGPINAILDGPCTKLLLGRFRCARAANSQPVPQLLPMMDWATFHTYRHLVKEGIPALLQTLPQ